MLRTTSNSEERSFLDGQPAHTKTDYQLLQEALNKEFADPEFEQGLVAALETRQGCHEPPQAYYSRLRQEYFGTRKKPDMEDELNFKTLLLRNLHSGITTNSKDQDPILCSLQEPETNTGPLQILAGLLDVQDTSLSGTALTERTATTSTDKSQVL